MEVRLPPELAREVRDLVAQGEFPDEATAVVELVRVGLGYRYRRDVRPAARPPPDEPPGPRGPAPGLPGDVNWVP